MLPLFDFLPSVLLLIFTPVVTYVANQNNSRYAGFRIETSPLIEFPSLFTQQDAVIINDLRERVSSFADHDDYFENAGFSIDIVAEIMKLASVKRIPLKPFYPDWKKIIN